MKPDVLAPGGRQTYRVKLGNTHDRETLEATSTPRPLGQSVASPGPSGELDKVTQMCGTSNAAALGTRAAISAIETLRALVSETNNTSVPDEYEAVLAKTFLVHGARWGESSEQIAAAIQTDSRETREVVTRCVGYGCTDVDKALTCSDQRVTLIGYGTLADGTAHIYRLPLPPSLAAKRAWRRMTVTLAWFTPIRPLHQKYRGAALWFTASHETLLLDRSDSDWQAVQRGTVQHEVFEGEAAIPFRDGDHAIVQVNCRADAGVLRERVRYGLVVSLEVAAATHLPIYEEVRTRLRQPVAVPLRSR